MWYETVIIVYGSAKIGCCVVGKVLIRTVIDSTRVSSTLVIGAIVVCSGVGGTLFVSVLHISLAIIAGTAMVDSITIIDRTAGVVSIAKMVRTAIIIRKSRSRLHSHTRQKAITITTAVIIVDSCH